MVYLQMPVDGTLTDPFGPRGSVPGLGDLGLHTGRDIAAPEGTLIHPAAPGVVTNVWWDAFVGGAGAGGNMVELDHGGGIRTRYAHMVDPSNKSVGDWCTLDSVIGLLGQSGAANGPHLHLELLDNGVFVDPDPYLHPRAAAGDASTAVPVAPPRDRRKPVAYITLDTNGKKARQKITRDALLLHTDDARSTALTTVPGDYALAVEIAVKGAPGTVVRLVARRYVYDAAAKRYSEYTYLNTDDLVVGPSGTGRRTFPVSNRVSGAGQRIGVSAQVVRGDDVEVTRYAAKGHQWEL
ncbi:M23 family metallopeptidase [Leucobacter allii]|uniref:M23 family metallopeptidase n=1 Tax=Leucobacter allii TaxID=2932247 RepID=A0ABY4FQJ4_9MICO|nr:M23 family metallopeptidase [Leucobacter allii]UOQ58546.1 M23 family metallopeptidase [Leucobacter allii]